MDLSVVIPIHNEVENIPHLHEKLRGALDLTPLTYELVFVDDGSNDGSTQALRELTANDPQVRVIELRRNFGQSAAMLAGIRESSAQYLVTLDGDQQNDPLDIPPMIAKLEEGYELVHGWRRDRQDRWLDRKLPSLLANMLIARITNFPVHDLGCTLKAMRREVVQELELYGEMHRFIPILAAMRGAKCCELEVRHHPRLFGKTKYGIGRTVRVLLDLVTIYYLKNYLASPMKLFGRWALWSAGLAVLLVVAGVAGLSREWTPSFLVGSLVLGALAGQFLGLGLLAEVASRIYFSTRTESVYAVRQRWPLKTLSTQAPRIQSIPERTSEAWRKAS